MTKRKDATVYRGQPWVYAVLAVGLVVVCGPFVWMVLSAFKSEREIYANPPTWIPENPTLANFTDLFSRMDVGTYLFNSVFIAVAATVGNVLFCSMVGYALAKIEFAGRRAVFGIVLTKMMIPGMVLALPTYVIVANLGLVDTYAGIILPGLAGPMGVFLMRQFIGGLPDDLMAAARVDGAGELRIFARIVLPLCRPAMATLGLLTFLGSWNSFIWPMYVAQSKEMYTLPVAIALLTKEAVNLQYGQLLAGSVTLVVPIIVVFVLFQRHFVQGIATTGLK
ncbi:carbohydrate ABC transporter permease [Nonomuraea sp. NBC_01738]|uniref:carbohydrate ABC transporter permease n=1 Tax=Nonomuraea sp. NBC_01738 TaxID=2976003 RepID=UPI002E1429DB|nr:carbohydrate ABC transporter permease [Nonomuraea sp. NBC_01738]